jgi:uncharacterized protein YbjT (DUF2867 family)
MTVLLFGGSSQIGHFLLPRLLATGEPVLAPSRYPHPPQAGVTWLPGELPADVPAMPPVSAIISFGPLPKLAEWLALVVLSDAPRVIAISSMSAETKRDSRVLAERGISQQLRDGEKALAAACARHGCAWTVFRPTLVYGAGLDKSLTPIAHHAARLRLFPLPSARGLRQPVHADDIAQAILAALDCPASAGRILPIGGGERLPAGEMFARVRRSLACSTVPLPLPAWLLRLGQHALPPLRGPLSRLHADLTADNDELQRLLGITPRPFRPDSTMWMPPR